MTFCTWPFIVVLLMSVYHISSHEHRISLQLFSSLFIRVCSFLRQSRTYFIRFIPKFFIVLGANKYCGLISNFTCLLLVYSKAIDFCILTLFLAALYFSIPFFSSNALFLGSCICSKIEIPRERITGSMRRYGQDPSAFREA